MHYVNRVHHQPASRTRQAARAISKLEDRRFSLMLLTAFAAFASFAHASGALENRVNASLIHNMTDQVTRALF